ncbi:prohibitin-like protein, partial [Cricetulus griseus]
QLLRIYTSIGEDDDEQVLLSITTEILKLLVARFDAGELITQQELVSRQSDYMVYYIDRFLYVEASLHPWDEAYLVKVDDFSDVFLE